MKPEDAEEYTQALGQVVSGGWRQIALGQRLGVPKALGLSVEEWVKERLGGYVKLGIPERQQAVIELRAEGQNKAEIAAVLGVDEKTVRNDLTQKPENSGNESKLPSDSTIEPENSGPTPEQWADLEAVRERAEQIAQQRAEHPERFAADEIFDVLAYAVDQCQTWTAKVQLDSPGTKTSNEWASLLNRLEALSELARRVYETKRETYAEQ